MLDRPEVRLVRSLSLQTREVSNESVTDLYFQITIPEIGTIRAKRRPYMFLTSNRTREIHDALKRRCLYHWIDYPAFEKEHAIVIAKLPGIESVLAIKSAV